MSVRGRAVSVLLDDRESVTKRMLMVDYVDDVLGRDKNPPRNQYAIIAETCGVLCLALPVASGK
jgi:hypothetical protein